MPRTREEQEQLDRRLVREVYRKNPAGVEAALHDGADPNTTIVGKMPLDVLTDELEQKSSWFRRSIIVKIANFIDFKVQLVFVATLLAVTMLNRIGVRALGQNSLSRLLEGITKKAFDCSRTLFFALPPAGIVVGGLNRIRNERIARRLGNCIHVLQQYGAVTTLELSNDRNAFSRVLENFCEHTDGRIPATAIIERIKVYRFHSPSSDILERMLSDCKDPQVVSSYIQTILTSRCTIPGTNALLGTLVMQNPEMAWVNSPESGESLLHVASRRNDPVLTKLLLRYGHDPSAMSNDAQIALTPAHVTPRSLAIPGSECAQLLDVSDNEWFKSATAEIRRLRDKLLGNYDALLRKHGYCPPKKDEYLRDIWGRIESLIVELEDRVSYFERITPRDRQLTSYLLRGMEILCGETLRINPRIAREGIGVICYARNQFGFGDSVVLGGILRDAYSRHIFPPRFPEFMAGDPVAGRIYRGLSAVYMNIAMTPQRPPRVITPVPATAKRSWCAVM